MEWLILALGGLVVFAVALAIWEKWKGRRMLIDDAPDVERDLRRRGDLIGENIRTRDAMAQNATGSDFAAGD